MPNFYDHYYNQYDDETIKTEDLELTLYRIFCGRGITDAKPIHEVIKRIGKPEASFREVAMAVNQVFYGYLCGPAPINEAVRTVGQQAQDRRKNSEKKLD